MAVVCQIKQANLSRINGDYGTGNLAGVNRTTKSTMCIAPCKDKHLAV